MVISGQEFGYCFSCQIIRLRFVTGVNSVRYLDKWLETLLLCFKANLMHMCLIVYRQSSSWEREVLYKLLMIGH